MGESLDVQAIHTALQHWFDLVDAANKYIDVEAPWTLRKTDPARMLTVLWCLLEAIRQLAILAQPFMPASAAKMLDRSEEHTSELQSLMRISYAVFCLKKKKQTYIKNARSTTDHHTHIATT